MPHGLIDERTTQHRDVFILVADRSRVEPRRPALVEVPLDAHFVDGHRFSFSVLLFIDT
jgi:hypothetical protein